ncbi:hypothetical protein [Mesorhizobium humile]|uniref:DUF680 domain-containing protein n=1 Tax=Mesorhizobium humile TaxID=3072313 RepID=A0ABU4YGG1_9HYPH|nr:MULTISPECIES: hypothetical protein [unclassified Mesorhizobium]MDX8457964.1 hypothetical protein [Mesorhizobium sp. VK2D]MDX8486043.1 hypothetical protein [Mesorhizobium sp. VK2B]
MTNGENRRETGATKYPATQRGTGDFSQDAATNKKPDTGIGLTRPVDEVNDKTHQSDGLNRRLTPSPSTEKVSGAGPALAEHSKDSKAPKSGRPCSAYVKK